MLGLSHRPTIVFAAMTVSRLSLGVVYLYASVQKTHQPFDFLSQVYDYQLVGPTEGMAVAIVLPWIEVALAICLLSGLVLGGALLCSILLGGLFVFVQVSVLVRGLDISCGCFSAASRETVVSYLTLVNTIGVFLLSLGTYVGYLWSVGDVTRSP